MTELEMSVADVLRAARAKIARPENWIQGTWARSAKGRSVRSYSRRATCWCAEGALLAVTGSCALFTGAVRYLDQAVPVDTIMEWNDAPDRKHAEVLAAFDYAIEMAEAANA